MTKSYGQALDHSLPHVQRNTQNYHVFFTSPLTCLLIDVEVVGREVGGNLLPVEDVVPGNVDHQPVAVLDRLGDGDNKQSCIQRDS